MMEGGSAYVQKANLSILDKKIVDCLCSIYTITLHHPLLVSVKVSLLFLLNLLWLTSTPIMTENDENSISGKIFQTFL